MITGHFILFYFVILQIPHLDKAVPFYDDKYLVLAVMPVLPFGNTRLRYIYAYLASIGCPYQLRKATAIIAVLAVVALFGAAR
jgi:hypothetical protein